MLYFEENKIDMKELYDYIIVGAGITGITLARLLDQKGYRVCVLESNSVAGGLCRTKFIDGHYLDIGGGHFFYSKYKEVYDFVFSHIPETEFNYFDRVSKIELGDEIIDYPVESSLWQLKIENQVKYLISVVRAGESSCKEEPKNYQEWIKWKLGDLIAENYMLPYNRKIWGLEPSEMDIDWLTKIPRLNVEEIIRYSLEKRNAVDKYPSHPGFYYPKEGGFQKIFDSIYNKIKNCVKLNEPVVSLKLDKDIWSVNDKYCAKFVLNTAPWNSLFKALGKPKELKDDFKYLQSNSIVISLFKENIVNNWHWLYIPDENKLYHREFYIPNFSKSSAKDGVYTETNRKRWLSGGSFKRNNKSAIYEHIIDNAYPIPVIGHSKSANKIIEYYRDRNLIGIGRWGQWQYLNSDVCIKYAIDFVNSIKNETN